MSSRGGGDGAANAGADEVLAPVLARHEWPARPLAGQPLGVDLLNTRWAAGGVDYDLFEHDELTAAWLVDRKLRQAAPLPAVRAHLREARDALAEVIAGRDARARLNAVLDHGRLRLALGEHGPVEHEEFDDPAAGAAWTCLRAYLRLSDAAPGRIRRCENPDCVLHFHDVSRSGDRRWCSMAVCGNRLKARRHSARVRGR
ncbi:putative RNA-binding Zn ribbon-like protein [Actinoalloteichus hoggarensis]|uniref:CGNR zinc finger n=1 Tax=Actinoalloteichus hoggarensis TaxID=1470176 RepID=A0A221W3Y1_9PSEU|nr:CGNR zinc finger domain-containing protein [Actinoalloteichus hoggarensis]ASO20464.1 CGNR zinc finger [Actinoalloteichus hoggarensis]MBB5923504.1 putative RNA-binding Zn ribbon-like protein [Actinoalloteichus hoggarensis]